MRRLATGIRRRLSYATVVSSLTAFVVLCGGAAFAADQLAKKSVGKKQLKANAVTTAKIKKNAVTATKIRTGAVDGSKVSDGSLGVGNLNLADVPFQRIVHEARGGSATAIGAGLTVVPLDNPSYTQAAGEDDFYYGAVDITFQPGCEAPRQATARVLVDSPNPTAFSDSDVVAVGNTFDEVGGTVTKQVMLSGTETPGVRFQPDAATAHALGMVVEATCKSGSGVAASAAAVDVIGVR